MVQLSSTLNIRHLEIGFIQAMSVSKISIKLIAKMVSYGTNSPFRKPQSFTYYVLYLDTIFLSMSLETLAIEQLFAIYYSVQTIK